MKRSKYFIIFSVLLLITILIVEIILRIFYHEQLKSRITSTNRVPDSSLVYTRVPNVIEHYCTPDVDNRFRCNNQGFTGPDFTTKKGKGIFRIIIMGNSDVEGMHMNGTNNFTVVMQMLFNRFYDSVEVVNCGLGGGGKVELAG